MLRRFFKKLVRRREKDDRRASLSPPPSASEGPNPGDMLFHLRRGELSEALQFLSQAGRTGQLEVFAADGRRGILGLRRGRVTSASFDEASGIDAVARMLCVGQAGGRFRDNAAPAPGSLRKTTPALLMEAAVRADELVSSGKIPPADAAADEDVSMQLPSVNPAGAAQQDPAARRPHNRERRILSGGGQVLVAATVAVLVACVTYDLYQRRAIDAEREQQEYRYQTYLKEMRERQQRRRQILLQRMNAWMEKAEKAWREEDIDTARKLVQRVLKNDDEHAAALAMAQKLTRRAELETVAPVKARAEIAWEKVSELDFGQGVRERVETIAVHMRTAADLFRAKQFGRAGGEYREAIRLAENLFKADRQRRQARAAREKTLRACQQAHDQLAVDEVPGKWRIACVRDSEAKNHFERGNFVTARAAWLNAAELYAKAADASRHIRRERGARATWDQARQVIDPKVLARFVPQRWQETRELEGKAEELSRKGQHREAADVWMRARKYLVQAHERALQQQREHAYRTAVQKAVAHESREEWDDAVKVYSEALKIEGTHSRAEAREGVERCGFAAAAEAAKRAARNENWHEVCRQCEEALQLRPSSEEMTELLQHARHELIPRLHIRALVAGAPEREAVLQIDGSDSHKPLPATLRVEPGKLYTIRITVPSRGTTWFEPFQTVYQGHDSGSRELVADMKQVTGPERGKAWQVPGTSLSLRCAPAGRFNMGSTTGAEDEHPVHPVRVSRVFWMLESEITNSQYRKFLRESRYQGWKNGRNPFHVQHFGEGSKQPAGDAFPVCYVNWADASAYCDWLTQRERRAGRLPPGYVYRLPTEAEWEYCVRAGGQPARGKELRRIAWFAANSRSTHTVGLKPANDWGLRDMQGNVREWCLDWYAPYPKSEQVDPVGPAQGVFRVLRGGSWKTSGRLCTRTYRSCASWREAGPDIGFRVVLAPRLEISPENGEDRFASSQWKTVIDAH